MSDIERERMRKEAADDVTSRPPGEGDSRLQAALRRYLGTSLFTMRQRNGSQSPPAPTPPRPTPPRRADDQRH
ncbi:hypothetical protein ABEG17_17000 [Pedococcus sp. KACC 23699]|uniref:Uncharacterized protein n=1 Tax=Pedococcus sp. KACC 23699 TaxID=3149228 RepID=A0AAU7JS24_9MICO